MEKAKKVFALAAITLGFVAVFLTLIFNVSDGTAISSTSLFIFVVFLLWIFTSLPRLLDMVVEWRSHPAPVSASWVGLAFAILVSAVWALESDSAVIPLQMPLELATWLGTWILAHLADLFL